MKRMYAFIAIILIFLGFAYFKEGGLVTKEKTPTVGILTLMHQPALDQIHKGVVAGLAKEGYHDGKNIKIDYQNAQGDQSNLKTMSSKLVNNNSNVLVGITTPAAQALANTTTKIPIVLGAVTDPKSAGLVKDNKHPGGNISGVSDQAPLEEQLELIQSFMPNLKTLGIIYTSSDNSAVTEEKKFVQLCKEKHVNLKTYSISNSNDLNQVSQEMMTQVDAVFVPTDNTIAGAMQTLVKNADAARKPIFPTVDTMVKDGGVATYSVNQYKLGVQSGELAGQILKGKKKTATTPIQYIRHGEPTLNLKQARKLGLHIPASFLRDAQKNGEVFK
ncbi:tryptophan ABC transporter substrate-binding protein [Paucilactobacillus kaifaensis]|uniref:tryptophan ABC transporter substrate-binding protein n=1 Tax=Paucilactobacillus kaifaensis TaxID=2559921 RepID=UPI0010F767D6|nr:tryptophan ABC transporter substrate-binding protein [Paucilactobacillus kaifaensis]